MNVEIGTVAAEFLFWEYLFRIFGIVSLQCTAVSPVRGLDSPAQQPAGGDQQNTLRRIGEHSLLWLAPVNYNIKTKQKTF